LRSSKYRSLIEYLFAVLPASQQRVKSRRDKFAEAAVSAANGCEICRRHVCHYSRLAGG
jgi:hypothetical protein